MTPRIMLVMSGGNALGAFHAGAFERLSQAGITPDLVAGSSIGAVTAALIAGNHPDRRILALRQFWARVAVPPAGGRRLASLAAVARARILGRPGLYHPLVPRLTKDAAFGAVGLYSLAPLRDTLTQLVDFKRVNAGAPRLTVQTTDLATGAPMIFDTAFGVVDCDHIVASCAFPVEFEPVEVGGRLLCDGAMVSNLPVGAVLLPPPQDDVLCFALDLFPARGGVPASVDDMVSRRMDIMLASQSAKEIEILRLSYAACASAGTLVLAHGVHDRATEQVGLKTFDYSAEAVAQRWDAGFQTMSTLLDRVSSPAPDGARFRYIGTTAGPGR